MLFYFQLGAGYCLQLTISPCSSVFSLAMLTTDMLNNKHMLLLQPYEMNWRELLFYHLSIAKICLSTMACFTHTVVKKNSYLLSGFNCLSLFFAVHSLKPADVKIIAALGDSLTVRRQCFYCSLGKTTNMCLLR